MSTILEKAAKLRERENAEAKLKTRVERMVLDAADDTETPRCALCNIFGRRRHNAALKKALEMGPAAEGASAGDTAVKSSALFGMGKRRVNDPSIKLKEAAVALEERIFQLEQRASEGRDEAKRCMQAGKKVQAMRALKKSKAVEKQCSANQSSLDALEAQLGLLEQAALQKTLATALASSSKSMKGQRKLLSHAESAIDDAADAREMAVELTEVMAEFGSNGVTADEDDLLTELAAMMAEDTEPPGGGTSVSIPDADAAEAGRALEAMHASWDEAEAARRDMPAVPNGVRAKVNEKQKLLA